MDNKDLKEKYNNPNLENEIFGEDTIDVDIENLSFELDGKGNLSGNGSKVNSDSNESNLDSPSSQDTSSTSDDKKTSEPQGESSRPNDNDMIDTSDDVNTDNTPQDQPSTDNNSAPTESSNPEGDKPLDDESSKSDNSDSNSPDEQSSSNEKEKKEEDGKNSSDEKAEDKKNDDSQNSDKDKKDDESNKQNDDSKNKSNDKNNNEKNNNQSNEKNPQEPSTKESNSNNNGLDKNTPQNNADNKPGANDKNKPVNNNANDAKKTGNPPGNKSQNNAVNNRNKRSNNNFNSGKRPKRQPSNGGSNFKNKASNGLKNAGKKAGTAIKETGKKAASKLVAFLASHPVVLGIIVAVIIFIIILFAVINASGAVITPGQGNDIKDEFSNFSENDKKILEEVNGINGITKPNAELAIYTVLFPYFESLQDGSVSTYLNGDSSELDEDEQKEYDENSNNSETKQKILESFGCDDLCQELLGSDGVNQIIKAYAKKSLKTKFKEFFGIDTSEDELDLDDLLENDENDNFESSNAIGEMDDPYLKLLSKSKYQKNLKNLLEKLSSTAEDGDYESETEYFEYLKDIYFESDAGYKALLIQSNDMEELKDAIIEQLKDGASLYEVYIADHCITSNASLTPLNSAGNINESIQGDIYIRLRDYRQTGNYWVASDHFSSPILYGTDSNPLEFARYIMGVAYAEVGEGVKNEAVAKTIMVTAKSFTVGRYKSMGGEYPKPEFDEANNRTIIEMRGNVGDQDFCDVYEGCKEGTYAWSTRTEMRGSGDPKGPLSSNDIKNLEQWWNDISDVYVVNSSNGNFAGNQYDDYNDSCKKGSCVSQTAVAIAAKKESDYMNILFNADNGGFDGDSYQAFNASTGGVYAVSTGNKYCPSSNITGSRQEIVNFAISMVGKIPYYFYEGQSDGYGALGHAISKNYDDNHFNEDASMTDHKGRNKYGLDCSGFVDFVFWNVLDDNLGNGNTTTLRSKSYKLSSYSDLIPGDLGFLSDEGSGTDQHVGIYIGNDEWVELNPNGVTKGEYPNFKVFYRPNILAELDQQENLDVVLTGSTVYENPIPGEKISNAYGVKGDLWARGYHTGADFGNNTDGKEIHSIGEGTVYCISCMGSSFGNHVVIEHADGYYSLYAHMSNKPKVIKGQKVNHSIILGNVGSTGNVTGPHLHLEFWKGVPWDSGSQDLNPANYIKL